MSLSNGASELRDTQSGPPHVAHDLRGFTGAGYDKGRGLLWQVAWFFVSGTVVVRWWCPPGIRARILRAFGARIGDGVVIRQGARIHWPWKLEIGDGSWIGDDAWLLNLEPITIGRNVCVSQQALLCTGSHDRRSPTFEYDNGPITVEDDAWIAARATVLRGTVVGRGAVVGATALVTGDVAPGALVLAPRAEVR
jgi:putative colanic acid biosynthesis acetyltransferase WcaF